MRGTCGEDLHGAWPEGTSLWQRLRPGRASLILEVEDKARVRCGRGGENCEEISSALPSRDRDSRTCEDDGGETFAAEVLSGHEGGERFGLLKKLVSCDFKIYAEDVTYLELAVNVGIAEDLGVLKELARAFLRFDKYPRVAGKRSDERSDWDIF
jgi:hypothetical protein